MTGIDALFESTKHLISYKDFVEFMQDWTIFDISENGNVIGGLAVKNDEVHINFVQPPKASIRKYLKISLGQVLNKYGHAFTSISENNHKALKWCIRLGFVVTKQENGVIFLRCDSCKYV
jgi:uncharacterized protein YuzE